MHHDAPDLAGHRILLVEDEVIVAMSIASDLEDAGAEVVQAHSLAAAVEASRTEAGLTGAVLDVNLKGREVFPAADILRDRRVPIVFHTGHARPVDVVRDYPEAEVLSKPSSAAAIAAKLMAVRSRASEAARRSA